MVSVAERARPRAEAGGRGGASSSVAGCVRSVRSRRNSVYGEGDPCAALMVIGEGPGETEDQARSARSSAVPANLLDQMLARRSASRARTCSSAIPSSAGPTLDDGVRLRNRAPQPDEMANCRPYLDEQIEVIRPSVILCLGAPAAKSFIGPKLLDHETTRPVVRRAERHPADRHVPSRLHPAPHRRRTQRHQAPRLGRPQDGPPTPRRAAPRRNPGNRTDRPFRRLAARAAPAVGPCFDRLSMTQRLSPLSPREAPRMARAWAAAQHDTAFVTPEPVEG
jgi:uracil-DNA glycosylase family 4